MKRKATSQGGNYDNESRKGHRKEPDKNKETDSIIKTDITEEYIDLQEIDDFLDVAKKNDRGRSRVKERSWDKASQVPAKQHQKKSQERPGARKKSIEKVKENINLDEIDDYLDAQIDGKAGASNADLYYRLLNKSKEYPITEVDGKMKCPFCRINVNARVFQETNLTYLKCQI